jgi:hypothetical protein
MKQPNLSVLIKLRTRREERAMAALAAAARHCRETQEAAASVRQQHHGYCIEQRQQEAQLLAGLAHGAFGHHDVQQVDEALKALRDRRLALEEELRKMDEQHAMALLRRSDALQTRNERWKAKEALSLLMTREQQRARLAEEAQADYEMEDRPQTRKSP